MAGIRSKDTRPELFVRRGLHRDGFRFKLHDRALPGKPDLVLPKYNAVIFVNGCFWHGHDCHLFRMPGTRPEFWEKKMRTNRARDVRAQHALRTKGWRVLTVWECALKGKLRLPSGNVIAVAADWLKSDCPEAEIRGKS